VAAHSLFETKQNLENETSNIETNKMETHLNMFHNIHKNKYTFSFIV